MLLFTPIIQDVAVSTFIYTRFALTGSLTLVLGDFMAFHSGVLGIFDGVWDRGALSSIPPSMLPEYATVLSGVLQPRGVVLTEFMTVSSPDGAAAAPSQFVSKAAVAAAFQCADFQVEVLEERDETEQYPDLQANARGIVVMEHVLLFTKKMQSK